MQVVFTPQIKNLVIALDNQRIYVAMTTKYLDRCILVRLHDTLNLRPIDAYICTNKKTVVGHHWFR